MNEIQALQREADLREARNRAEKAFKDMYAVDDLLKRIGFTDTDVEAAITAIHKALDSIEPLYTAAEAELEAIKRQEA